MAVRIDIRGLGFSWMGVRERKMGVRERSQPIREHKNRAGKLSKRVRTDWKRAGQESNTKGGDEPRPYEKSTAVRVYVARIIRSATARLNRTGSGSSPPSAIRP